MKSALSSDSRGFRTISSICSLGLLLGACFSPPLSAQTAVLATLTSPTSGSVLSGSSATFTWSPGTGVTGYLVYIGTTGPGASNVYDSGSLATSTTSVTVTNLPTNGVTLYFTLFSKISGAWQGENYTFTEAGSPVLAAMISPTQGGSLPASTATFTWTAGSGPTGYLLYLGTTGPGSDNLYNSGAISSTTATVTGLPTSGAIIYATLFSRIDQAWKGVNYTFYEATSGLATLTSPAQGSTLSGSSVTFTWTASTEATGYLIYIGQHGPGDSDVYDSGVLTATSATIKVPANGVTLYFTLFSRVNGAWQPEAYTFTESGTPVLAALTSPAPSSFVAGTVSFSWSPGGGPTSYMLYLGTKGAGSSDLFNSGTTTATSVSVTGIPIGGGTIYATLYSRIDNAWQAANFTYSEYTLGALTSPAQSSTLSGSSATFTWTPGAGASNYLLYVGTGANDANLFNSGQITGTSITVNNLPTWGVKIYATLFTKINGAWQGSPYISFTESGTPVLAALTTPTPGTSFSNPQTFAWSAGGGPTGYLLYIGTQSGGSNLYDSGSTTSTSVSVSNLPVTGETLYVTLFSMINGAWQGVKYTFTPVIYIPSALTCSKSTITGSATDSCTVTLNQNAGSGGATISLSSSNAAVTVPSTVTVAANSASATFSAGVSSVATNQAVTLTASANSQSATFSMQLNAPVPSSLTCGNSTMTGSGTDSCSVTLNAGAPSGGLNVNLSSSNAAVTLPLYVTVPANSTSASFTANVTAVTSGLSVTLTASDNSTSATFTIQLNAAVASLSLSSSSIAFGDTAINSPVTQTLTLTSSGTIPVTVNSVTISGSGFTMTAPAFPETLNPNQTAVIDVTFDATSTNTATGSLTISSNATSGSSLVVGLSGTGTSSAYQVMLNWQAPSGSTPPIQGYNIYRANSGSTTYQLLNTASLDTSTSYTDNSVVAGDSYDYYVESVDTAGVSSGPSTVINVDIP